MSPALAIRRGLLLVTCAARQSVAIVDMKRGAVVARLPIRGEPFGVAVSPGENIAVIGSLRPDGNASNPENAAVLTLIDPGSRKRLAEIRLPAGSTVVRDVAVSPDGRWAYAVHALGRFNLPTTQLDRGWVNTNALSIIDLQVQKHYATVLLDHPLQGSADPWGIALSKDGGTLWVTLSGVHQVARLDLARLHRYLEGKIPDDSPLRRLSEEFSVTTRSAWLEIRRDPSRRTILVNDLSALDLANLIVRTPLPGSGPRGAALSPDGQRLAVAQYFSGNVVLLDTAAGKVRATLSAGPSRPPDPARIGERMFHDATLSYQRWLSCATCHPDGRTDGLNWDLLNDGIGNPKNTRSLLLAHQRSPMMSHGVRSNLAVAAKAGFRFIEFREPEPGETEAVIAYIRSLKPQTSPYRINGRLSARAERGKRLFESQKTKCAECHYGPLYTDQKQYDVGTRSALDSSEKFVTPTLAEVWRTAPYLHDGSARTMREVLTARNRLDRHGITSRLSEEELAALAEYVLSL
jgi:mono/diheme cytochrome c family protein